MFCLAAIEMPRKREYSSFHLWAAREHCQNADAVAAARGEWIKCRIVNSRWIPFAFLLRYFITRKYFRLFHKIKTHANRSRKAAFSPCTWLIFCNGKRLRSFAINVSIVSVSAKILNAFQRWITHSLHLACDSLGINSIVRQRNESPYWLLIRRRAVFEMLNSRDLPSFQFAIDKRAVNVLIGRQWVNSRAHAHALRSAIIPDVQQFRATRDTIYETEQKRKENANATA